MSVNDFKWVEDISELNEDLNEVDVQYRENLHNLHNDLPFLSERIKIEKVEKLVANLHGKEQYVIHITRLKQALNHRLESLNLIKKVD